LRSSLAVGREGKKTPMPKIEKLSYLESEECHKTKAKMRKHMGARKMRERASSLPSGRENPK